MTQKIRSSSIYTVNFTAAWSMMLSFPLFLYVCAWQTTQNLHGRLSSVGAHPNRRYCKVWLQVHMVVKHTLAVRRISISCIKPMVGRHIRSIRLLQNLMYLHNIKETLYIKHTLHINCATMDKNKHINVCKGGIVTVYFN